MRTVSTLTGVAIAFLCFGPAHAAVPSFDMTCADGIEVRADADGMVLIDGSEAEVEIFNEDYAEATLGDVTISISVNTDGTPALSYTGADGANGICTPRPGSIAETDTAKIPFFNAECPGGISVHADEGGPVYINGEEARFTSFSGTYFEAEMGETTVSVTNMPDGSLDVAYTGPNRENGVCRLE